MEKKISYKAIPNCLRKYRRIRGFKQKQVAKILGFKTSSRISRWEKGACFPSIVSLLKLAYLYRTMPDTLFLDLAHTLRNVIREQEEKVVGKATESNG
ncbi:MAG: helix-turn-helix transcriptional regulator [Bacteroidota bacterium]